MDEFEFMPIIDLVGSDDNNNNNIIKVIGVGGGGGNAVTHMYHQGIKDVSFVITNTDAQALDGSPVPVHLQLGKEGLGAGNKPEKARMAAEESADDIRKMLDDGTRMVFITAGMGGGTGTGASPVIARISKEMDILTVGIVTIPFEFEGPKKIIQALDGVEEISKHVDALLVINNERLRELYPDLTVLNAFAKADDTLCNAASSIADIITMHGLINLDFKDVRTVLLNGGVAIMSTGYGTGDGRITQAIENALHSPLLNNNDVYNSKKMLLHISFGGDAEDGTTGLMMDEMNEINEFMTKMRTTKVLETKWGLSVDPSLGDKVKVTILATGFGVQDINTAEMDSRLNARSEEQKKIEAERAQAELERERRREDIYGNIKGLKRHKTSLYYTMRDEDLDNDDIIIQIENSPTYKRRNIDLKFINERSAATVTPIPNAGERISFTNDL